LYRLKLKDKFVFICTRKKVRRL